MLLNAEHYQDTTAGLAIASIHNAGKKRVFSATPAFTSNKTQECRQTVHVSKDISVPISDMTMDEVKVHLRTCAQSLGDPLKCLECKGGCAFGTRAIDLLDHATRSKSQQQLGAEKGAQAQKSKAMHEYAAAIDSGDPIKYILEHSKFSVDAVAARYAATAKLKRWKEKYGDLPARVSKQTPEEPHLMQMPCLSKKVAAEKAGQEEKDQRSQEISDVFTAKLKELRDQIASIQEQIDALTSNKDLIQRQISQIEDTAVLLDIAI